MAGLAAPSRSQAAPPLVLWSATDSAVFARILDAFAGLHPGIAVDYHEIGTQALHRRLAAGTGPLPDLVISPALDLQVALVNRGLAQPLPGRAPAVPSGTSWRGELFGFTLEPEVVLLNRAAFAGLPHPRSHAALATLIRDRGEMLAGRLATYDIRRSGIGYLLSSQAAGIGPGQARLAEIMGRTGTRLFTSSAEMFRATAEGEVLIATGVLGSYADALARHDPRTEILLMEDYNLAVPRSGFVHRGAARPEAAGRLLRFLLSAPGQDALAAPADGLPGPGRGRHAEDIGDAQPHEHGGDGAGAALGRHDAGGDHRAVAEESALREAGDHPRRDQRPVVRRGRRGEVADHEERHQQHQRRAMAEPRQEQGHHRRPGHHADRIGGDDLPGGRDRDAEIPGNRRQQPHRGEFGGADAEGAEAEGEERQRDAGGPARNLGHCSHPWMSGVRRDGEDRRSRNRTGLAALPGKRGVRHRIDCNLAWHAAPQNAGKMKPPMNRTHGCGAAFRQPQRDAPGTGPHRSARPSVPLARCIRAVGPAAAVPRPATPRRPAQPVLSKLRRAAGPLYCMAEPAPGRGLDRVREPLVIPAAMVCRARLAGSVRFVCPSRLDALRSIGMGARPRWLGPPRSGWRQAGEGPGDSVAGKPVSACRRSCHGTRVRQPS